MHKISKLHIQLIARERRGEREVRGKTKNFTPHCCGLLRINQGVLSSEITEGCLAYFTEFFSFAF